MDRQPAQIAAGLRVGHDKQWHRCGATATVLRVGDRSKTTSQPRTQHDPSGLCMDLAAFDDANVSRPSGYGSFSLRRRVLRGTSVGMNLRGNAGMVARTPSGARAAVSRIFGTHLRVRSAALTLRRLSCWSYQASAWYIAEISLLRTHPSGFGWKDRNEAGNGFGQCSRSLGPSGNRASAQLPIG